MAVPELKSFYEPFNSGISPI